MVSLAESAAFVAYEASSVASALEAWSAVMLASRLASCAAAKARWRGPAGHLLFWCLPPVEVRPPWRAGRPVRWCPPCRRGRCRGDCAQESGRDLRVHLRGSVDGRLQGVRGQGAGVRLGVVASRLASSEASAAAVTAPRRALATLVSTSSGVILAAMSRECWSTTVLRP